MIDSLLRAGVGQNFSVFRLKIRFTAPGRPLGVEGQLPGVRVGNAAAQADLLPGPVRFRVPGHQAVPRPVEGHRGGIGPHMITQVPGDGQSLPLAAVGFKQNRAVRFAEPQVIPARIADVFQFQPQLSVGIPDRILPIVVHPGQGKARIHRHREGHVASGDHLPGVFFDLTAFRLHKANGDGLFFGSFPGTAGEQQRRQHCQGQNSLHRAHLPTIPVNSIALPVSQGKKDVPNGQFFATNRSFSAQTAQKSE